MKNENITERRAEVAEYIINFGAFGIPTGTRKELASKWGCDIRTIERDVNYIVSHIKIPKMQKMGQKFLLNYEKALKISNQLMQNDNPDTQAKGVALFNQTQDHFTKMCEKYGFKEIITGKPKPEEKPKHTALTKEEREAIIKRLGEK